MFGYSVEEVLRDQSPLDLVAPEDRDRVRRSIRERMEGEASRVHYQFRGLRKDGSTFDVEARGYSLEFQGEPAVGGTLLEVTERESTKHDLAESRRRFQQLSENIEATMFLYDLEHEELLFVNSHYETMFGLGRENARENPLAFVDIVHPEDREWVMDRIQNFLEDPDSSPTDYEYRIVDDDGEVHWLWTQWVPVAHRDGHVARVAGYTTDITRVKRISQNLEQSLEETQTLLREVHHRVKNNLQVIVSLLGLQKRQFEDGEMKRILERCQNRIFSMALIHQKLYDTDRFAEVDFSEYVPDLVEDLHDAQISEEIAVSMEYDLESCPLDFDRLVPFGLALSEVVTNALEHAFVGRETGTIEITSRRREERLDLSVRDDGVGWTPDGPIEEADSLGLKLLDSLIQKQLRGGVEFEQNDGVTVHFSIPLEPDF